MKKMKKMKEMKKMNYKLTEKDLKEVSLYEKVQKLSNNRYEGFIHVYKNKDGFLDAQWQYDRGSMDMEVEGENYSETMDRIVATIQLDGDHTEEQISEWLDGVIQNEV